MDLSNGLEMAVVVTETLIEPFGDFLDNLVEEVLQHL